MQVRAGDTILGTHTLIRGRDAVLGTHRVRATAAGERVSRVFRDGDQGRARLLARTLADDLTGDLAPAARPDDRLRNADGRELADAIRRRASGSD
jgi:hypothetical protein